MNRANAERINELALRIASMLDDSIALVQKTDKTEAFEAYRGGAAKVMASLYMDVLAKIWTDHPELKPTQMGGSCEVDPAIYEPRFHARR